MNAQEFQRMREKMRLTQKDLALRLEVTENTIYRYENDKGKIPKTVELAMMQIRRQLHEEDAKDL